MLCERGRPDRCRPAAVIRSANKADADRIGRLWLEMVEYHQAFDPLTFRAADDGADLYAQRILQRLTDPWTRILVAELEGDIVAYALGLVADITTEMFQPLRSGLLADIFVMAEHRRQGLGRELVAKMSDWFQTQKVGHFEWHVSAQNPAAIQFWKAIGGKATMLRMRAEI